MNHPQRLGVPHFSRPLREVGILLCATTNLALMGKCGTPREGTSSTPTASTSNKDAASAAEVRSPKISSSRPEQDRQRRCSGNPAVCSHFCERGPISVKLGKAR